MKKVAIDCDGVLADPTSHYIEVLGIPPSDILSPYKFEVEDMLAPQWHEPVRALMADPQFWMTLPKIPYAEEGVEYLRNRNCELSVMTSPYKRCPMWYDARIFWLEKAFNFNQNDVMVGRKKSWLLGADVLIDDFPGHVLSFDSAHPMGHGWLFNAPHNQDCPHDKRLDWTTITRIFG